MALTRNESTVHEKTVSTRTFGPGPVGLALSREIDLRLFFMHWHAGFAVTEESANGNRPAMRSLQFMTPPAVPCTRCLRARSRTWQPECTGGALCRALRRLQVVPRACGCLPSRPMPRSTYPR